MNTERRLRRSKHPTKAIDLQLEFISKEVGIERIFVADRDGLLLGSSTDAFDNEILAAYAPLPWKEYVSKLNVVQSILLDLPQAAGLRLSLCKFDAGGSILTLGALHDKEQTDSLQKNKSLRRAITGVQRILST